MSSQGGRARATGPSSTPSTNRCDDLCPGRGRTIVPRRGESACSRRGAVHRVDVATGGGRPGRRRLVPADAEDDAGARDGDGSSALASDPPCTGPCTGPVGDVLGRLPVGDERLPLVGPHPLVEVAHVLTA